MNDPRVINNAERGIICDELQREIDKSEGAKADKLTALRKKILSAPFKYDDEFVVETITHPLVLWAHAQEATRVILDVVNKLNRKVKELESSLATNQRVVEHLRKLQMKGRDLRDFREEMEAIDFRIKELICSIEANA